MHPLRKLLYPLALLYGGVMAIRNWFYDRGIFKSHHFGIPIIAVGNLSMGGTGKTPQVEYLIRLLSPKYRVATLSRGYKRKSKGFVLANQQTTATDLGDEPYQFYLKFPEIPVAVDADRVQGISKLIDLAKPQLIILDDAFQHRRVKADFYILLTPFDDLYADDLIFPAGNLREAVSGAKRANVIVVTKCPTSLTEDQRKEVIRKLKPKSGQQVFFSTIEYDAFALSAAGKFPVEEIKSSEKVLLAGIARPEPFFNFLGGPKDLILKYPDHHNFSDAEIEEIQSKAGNKMIVTTEKDYVRLTGRLPNGQLYYLPINSAFFDSNNFNNLILEKIKTFPAK